MACRQDIDGFQLLSGVLAVIAGPVMLVCGSPAGWAVLVGALGVVLLVCQWAIVMDVQFADPTLRHLLAAVFGVGVLWIATLYLSRAADDLPHLLPGRARHSDHMYIARGLALFVLGAYLCTRAIVDAHPSRRSA